MHRSVDVPVHCLVVVPIGRCPDRSTNPPTQSALPTDCRATPSPARSAQLPGSCGSPGGRWPTRAGWLRRRKIVIRAIAIIQENICHGLGFNQFVTNIFLNYAYGSPTPPKPATKCSGSMVGPSSSARSRLTVVQVSPPDTARTHCWTRFVAATGQYCSPTTLSHGRSHCRQRGCGRTRCSARQSRAVRCREV